MIRLSRLGAITGCGTYLVWAALGAVGCAQSGSGNGGMGGAGGTGGIKTGATGGVGGAGGVGGVGGIAGGGGVGGANPCQVDPPITGTPCSGSFTCSFFSQTCCGVVYPGEVATCSNGSYSVKSVETPCQSGGGSCGGASGAGGGGAGGAGGVPLLNVTCPANPTPAGFSCSPDEQGWSGCEYGSTICCGIKYPTLLVSCQQDAVVQQAIENPCSNLDYVCPTGGNGGAAGAGAVGGAGGAAIGRPNCPTQAPAAGAACDSTLRCTYGSVSCCGTTYPTMLVLCGVNGVEQEPLDNPCGSGNHCATGGAGGGDPVSAGGAGGATFAFRLGSSGASH